MHRQRPSDRRRRAAQALLIAAALVSTGCGQAKTELAGQNLLFITIDTLRADRLGAYGYEKGSTPNLDRLARRGTRFDRAFSPVPLTLPSHVTMFTGRYPFQTGVRINGMHFLEAGEVTLAELFKARGYNTAAFVSAYVLIEKFGLGQGFDEYEDSLQTMDNLFRFYSETPADEVFERFSEWLGSEPRAPFFCWIHMYDPHQPFEPPAAYRERFAADLYDGEVAFVDEQVGRILDRLDETGLTDSTVVVVTSDHGEAFGEHVEVGHGLLTYNETLRVPLIISAPGLLPEDSVVETRVGLVDLTPTFSELFGLDAPAESHGRSIAHLLERPAGGSEPPLYFESLAGVHEKNWAARQGVIADGFKFIRLPQPELYDLENDPQEVKNLARAESGKASALDGVLRSMLLSAPEDAASERVLTSEDRRQLEALGYLSSSGASSKVMDPKQGIDIEMKTRKAKALVSAGELGQAEALLEGLLAKYPDAEVVDIYELQWSIRAKRGDEAGAIAALEEAIAKLPQSVVRMKLASYLHVIGRLDEAEAQARLILERDPRLSHAISLLGMIAESRGDLEQARRHFEEALAIEPRSVPLEAKIADIRARQGDLEGALATYRRLEEIGALDTDPEHLFKAAALFSVSGDLQRAESLFERGLALEPAGQHLLALALVQFGLGKSASATRNLETALGDFRDELDPQKVALAEQLLRQARGAGG